MRPLVAWRMQRCDLSWLGFCTDSTLSSHRELRTGLAGRRFIPCGRSPRCRSTSSLLLLLLSWLSDDFPIPSDTTRTTFLARSLHMESNQSVLAPFNRHSFPFLFCFILSSEVAVTGVLIRGFQGSRCKYLVHTERMYFDQCVLFACRTT